MKPLYFALSLLLCTGVRAQDAYQLFRPGVQYLYENPDYDRDDPYQIATQYYGLRVDTLGLVPLYGSLQTDEDRQCVDRVPSPFGYSIGQYPDSTMMYFSETDSLVIRQRAPLGERWVARNDEGALTYAEVTQIAIVDVFDEFLSPDRIKVITFYGADGSTEIGVPIWIAEDYGLVEATRFYQVADEGRALSLVGTSELPQTLQLPADSLYGRAYAGDVFQLASNDYGLFPGVDFDRLARRLSTVTINSVDSITEAGFTYTVTADLYEYLPDLSEQDSAVYNLIALDTTFSYFFPRLPTRTAILQPGARDDIYAEGFIYSQLVRAEEGPCETFSRRMSTPVQFIEDDPCGQDLSQVDNTPENRFSTGIPFYLEDLETITGPRYLFLDYYETFQFKCGTLTERDNITVPTRDTYLASEPYLEVYPNPVADVLRVHYTASDAYEVRLYNVAGAQVQRQWVTGSQPITIPITTLPTGAYFLVVFEQGRPVARRRVIIE